MAVKTIDAALPVDIFGVQTNIPLIHQVVTAQLAAARQGTHDVKSRGEVSGGGKKPYRQKGTGRARQGSIRAPQYNGGGIVHGPTPRSYDQRTPKKMKAAALRGALSDRARSGRLHVVESLVTGEVPSTKAAVAAIAELTARRRVLVVVKREDALTAKSLRNVTDLVVLTFDQLNTYDVVLSDDVIFTQAAFEAFVEARSAEGTETVALSAAVVEADAKPAAKAKKAPAKKAPAKKAEAAKVDAEPAEKVEAPAADATEGATKTQPYGPGSKAPLKSGNAPKGHEIKGNADSMKYHTADSPWYDQTVAEVWFDTEETAQAAGFTKAGE
ncbi:50S ribosomal protein L4 [Aeromicrobium sp. 50.2.37]|uniref:50S ribosomal protein L4, sunset domain variant n=1 Tax=Aeromicrobium sp. 50.2.37 TaxID=2969305 RepID=UPI00214F92B4|nr:50S ribosomal protein L4 [Aeromicrobium sp. 50.2.37]MCR4513978.1 50S ribosomal protein L4 [Aeromicrobium sp. 50.2.37]